MPSSTARPNQATLRWPKGTMTAAASSGPMRACPCCRPPGTPTARSRAGRPRPGARCATTPGGRSDEPMPTNAAASSTTAKLGAKASSISPTSVDTMPERQRVRLRPAIGEQADQRLQQRRRELVGQRDQADLGEAQRELALQDRIHRQDQRLHHVVDHVRGADGAQDAVGRLCLVRSAYGNVLGSVMPVASTAAAETVMRSLSVECAAEC